MRNWDKAPLWKGHYTWVFLQSHSTWGEVPEGWTQFNEPLGRALQSVPAKTVCICPLPAEEWWLMEKTTGENGAVRATVGLVEKIQNQISQRSWRKRAHSCRSCGLAPCHFGTPVLEAALRCLQHLTQRAGVNIPNRIQSTSHWSSTFSTTTAFLSFVSKLLNPLHFVI